MQNLAQNIREQWPTFGSHVTEIPSLIVHRYSGQADTPFAMPNMGDPYLYFVVAGMVRLHTPSGIMDYMPGQCSASAIDTPDTAYVLVPSEAGDCIALSLMLTLDDVTSVMIGLDETTTEAILAGTLSQEEKDAADGALADIAIRLVEALNAGARKTFLVKHLTHEAIFTMLMGSSGKQFLESIIRVRDSEDIYAANSWIKDNYRESFVVEELAARWNMSPSTFHQKFKNAVGMGPLQCQKRLRLTEARRMMLDEDANVTEAAFAVGYESSSQFSRDYKKAFGATPSEDIKALKAHRSF